MWGKHRAGRRKKPLNQPTVYILIDPRDSTVHYVGCSSMVQTRAWQHISDAKNYPEKNPRKSKWIRELLRMNLKPIVIGIEKPGFKLAEEREQYWIYELAKAGAPITNCFHGNPRRYVVDHYTPKN